MYKIAVCEDKQGEQEEIVNMTKGILQKNQIDCHIFCYQRSVSERGISFGAWLRSTSTFIFVP